MRKYIIFIIQYCLKKIWQKVLFKSSLKTDLKVT